MHEIQDFEQDSFAAGAPIAAARTPAVRGSTPTRSSHYLRQVRLQAALARALLDELEMALPVAVAQAPFDAACQEQLSEELAALAHRLSEFVAAMVDVET